MKIFLFIFLLTSFSLIGQNYSLKTYPEHKGKLINQIIKNGAKEFAILSPFYADFEGVYESNVCELNEFHKLVNCRKLSDSTFYKNSVMSYDSTSYIFSGIKSSDLYVLDTVIIEKRDLNFKLLQKYSYNVTLNSITAPLVLLDSSFHLFVQFYDKYDENLIEFIIHTDLDLSKITKKVHDINTDYIDFFKALKVSNKFLAWYLWGLAEVDSSFFKPKRLNDSILIRKGNVIDAIDSGYVAFGSAIVKDDASELGIIKYDPNLNFTKIDTFGEGINSNEYPAIAYSLTKNNKDYYVTAFIGIEGNIYIDTSSNLLYLGRFDKKLNRIWLKKLGGDKHYFVWGVEASKNGGCCIYGMCRSKGTNYNTIPFIMCVDENGSVTSIDEQIPSYLDFTLLGNPGGNELKFNLEGSSSSFTYQVANLNGQIVSSGIGNPGLNIVSATTWPAGVYVISFTNKGTIIHSEKWLKAVR